MYVVRQKAWNCWIAPHVKHDRPTLHWFVCYCCSKRPYPNIVWNFHNSKVNCSPNFWAKWRTTGWENGTCDTYLWTWMKLEHHCTRWRNRQPQLFTFETCQTQCLKLGTHESLLGPKKPLKSLSNSRSSSVFRKGLKCSKWAVMHRWASWKSCRQSSPWDPSNRKSREWSNRHKKSCTEKKKLTEILEVFSGTSTHTQVHNTRTWRAQITTTGDPLSCHERLNPQPKSLGMEAVHLSLPEE